MQLSALGGALIGADTATVESGAESGGQEQGGGSGGGTSATADDATGNSTVSSSTESLFAGTVRCTFMIRICHEVVFTAFRTCTNRTRGEPACFCGFGAH